ncbi:AbrB family transcriptional regulator [Evansella halocellulosilytica]|uniref:AbrB family transcriptional regulator n=1 Tax=Evansella halocellulosilytica TaxID=2011013 RepID=UPI000BB92680|nr:AbrB family transcriptional regulator [Evansella halocellulosilytica]
MDYILFIVLSFIGGWTGIRLKIPMGAFLGAMAAVGLWKVYGLSLFTANELIIFIAQVLLGIIVGLSFSQFNMQEFKKIVYGLLIISAGVLCIIFGLGWLLSSLYPLSIKTAIIAAAPGSIAEMATLSNELNLDPLLVVSLHIVRVVVVVFLLSLFVNYIQKIRTAKAKTKGVSS